MLVFGAFSNHKIDPQSSGPMCSRCSTIRCYTFQNTIMMLEMLNSFIPECLSFTLCRADPHSIHGQLQQRQIMVKFWVLGGWLIKNLQTHFIIVSKSYLRCGTQRQSSRGALMHKTMFSRKMFLHFTSAPINAVSGKGFETRKSLFRLNVRETKIFY